MEGIEDSAPPHMLERVKTRVMTAMDFLPREEGALTGSSCVDRWCHVRTETRNVEDAYWPTVTDPLTEEYHVLVVVGRPSLEAHIGPLGSCLLWVCTSIVATSMSSDSDVADEAKNRATTNQDSINCQGSCTHILH